MKHYAEMGSMGLQHGNKGRERDRSCTVGIDYGESSMGNDEQQAWEFTQQSFSNEEYDLSEGLISVEISSISVRDNPRYRVSDSPRTALNIVLRFDKASGLSQRTD
jgi:hypothetical protein